MPRVQKLRDGHGRNSGQEWGGTGYVGHLQPAERTQLVAYYRPHNQELYALLGRDLEWERMPNATDGRGPTAAASVVESSDDHATRRAAKWDLRFRRRLKR